MERIQKLYVFVVGHAPGPKESDGEPLLPRDLAYPHHYTEILRPRKAVLPANGYVHRVVYRKIAQVLFKVIHEPRKVKQNLGILKLGLQKQFSPSFLPD